MLGKLTPLPLTAAIIIDPIRIAFIFILLNVEIYYSYFQPINGLYGCILPQHWDLLRSPYAYLLSFDLVRTHKILCLGVYLF